MAKPKKSTQALSFAPVVAKSELKITIKTTATKLLRQLETRYVAAKITPLDLQRETKNLYIEHQAKTLDQRCALGERFFVLKGANGQFWGKGKKSSFKKWLMENKIARATAYRYIDDYLLNTLRKFGKVSKKKAKKVVAKYDKQVVMSEAAHALTLAVIELAKHGDLGPDTVEAIISQGREDADWVAFLKTRTRRKPAEAEKLAKVFEMPKRAA